MKFTITIPTYSTYLNVYCSKKKKKLNQWNNQILANFDSHEDAFNSAGKSYDIYLNEDGYRCADIVLDQNQISIGLIAHEVMHSVFYIMRHVDITLTQESEEAYTFLNGYLMNSIMQHFEPNKIK